MEKINYYNRVQQILILITVTRCKTLTPKQLIQSKIVLKKRQKDHQQKIKENLLETNSKLNLKLC